MKQRLSAMMDDAADEQECESCVRRLKEDSELRESWDLYHLIGDALRGHTAPEIAERVQRRIAAEPTVLAPRPVAVRGRRAAWHALPIAASVAAVALVGWMALPLFEGPGGPAPQPVAQAPEAPPVAQAPEPQPVPVAQGVGDYLLAHQRFSPSVAIGGIAPYIRSVTEESGAR
jgi:sigma-E factor negative regulatory protein RseA